MDQYRCTEQCDHQHNTDGCEAGDHHKGRDHGDGKAQLHHGASGCGSTVGIDAEVDEIAVTSNKQQEHGDARDHAPKQIAFVGGQNVTEEQGFHVNPQLKKRNQQDTKGDEPRQNRVHHAVLPPGEAPVEVFSQQGTKHGADQSSSCEVPAEGQCDHDAR